MSDDQTSRQENRTIETDTKLRHGTITSVDVGISSADAGGSASDNLQPPYEICVLKSLRRIIRALDLYSRKLKSVYGLTVPQLVCLTAICKRRTNIIDRALATGAAESEHYRRHSGSIAEDGTHSEREECHGPQTGHADRH